MTATRIGLATLTVLWVLAAGVLWRTEVPADLPEPRVEGAFAQVDPARAERHDRVLRLLALGSLAAQLGALALLARRPPSGRGPELVRAAHIAAAAAGTLFLARLPFGAAALWWQRRYEVAQLGYGEWLLDRLGPLAVRAALLAGVAALALALARRLGRRWWIGAAPVLVLAGAVVVLVQPLVSPRLEPPSRAVVAEVAVLAEQQGLAPPAVELRQTEGRTRQLNAEAIGFGPTTRVVLWETTLAIPAGERRFLVAHELAHVSRAHVWKGLAWFALLLVPGLALLARLVPLDSPRTLARAVLVAFVLLLAATPLANGISRRYEAEADWVALETTRDPDGARGALERIAELGVRHPDPPRLWSVLFGTHPAPGARVEMTAAWAATRSEARSRGGS